MTTTDDALLGRLRAAFLTEARRRLDVVDRDLRAIEQGADERAPLFDELRREAHTLRGAARAAELADAAAIAHELETRLRTGECPGAGSGLDELHELVEHFAAAGLAR
jgi:two-component system chemotaxis sensor kinase CheA